MTLKLRSMHFTVDVVSTVTKQNKLFPRQRHIKNIHFHGLESRYLYWYRPKVFRINIVNIGHQYWPHQQYLS